VLVWHTVFTGLAGGEKADNWINDKFGFRPK